MQQAASAVMAGRQGLWDELATRSTARVENKDPKHKYKAFLQQPLYSSSWSPDTDFSKLASDSRVQELNQLIDPRQHLLSVLDEHQPPPPPRKIPRLPRRATQGAHLLRLQSNQRDGAPVVKAGSLHNLRAPPTMLASDMGEPQIMLATDPLVGFLGIPNKRTLRASGMRSLLLAAPLRGGSFSVLPPTSALGIPASVEPGSPPSSPDDDDAHCASRAPTSGRAPALEKLSFSEPILPRRVSEPGIPRRWSDPKRTPTPSSPPSPSTPPSTSGIKFSICWLPPRSFTSEFLERDSLSPLGSLNSHQRRRLEESQCPSLQQRPARLSSSPTSCSVREI
ncbi:hypothetical protein T484DRAFT_1823363 [Baffinella frigidus]|nr:hypothetical protein T484DRAFT_1823363 [Cryptophyta sp. CCMP2293]